MVFTEFHFEYAGTSSRDYGLIVANLNSSEFTQASGDVELNVFFNRKNRRNYLIGDDNSGSAISTEIDILREDSSPIPFEDVKSVEKWLFKHNNYCKFYVDKYDDAIGDTIEIVDGKTYRSYLNCRFLNPNKILDGTGQIIGWTVIMECDSHMLWQDTIEKTYTLTGSSNTISVVTDNIDNDYIYPTVTITTGTSGGDVSIINTTDDATRFTKFASLPASTPVIMDCEKNMLTDGYYEKFVGMNFIRLLDGTNNFAISGDIATIKFEYNNRRMF